MNMKLGWGTLRAMVLNFVRLSFGEAVPKIETAIDYVEKADVFVIIGTSMNVYPAAGLLNYVHRGVPVYLIDPKEVRVNSDRQIHVIQKGASEGMAELKSILLKGIF